MATHFQPSPVPSLAPPSPALLPPARPRVRPMFIVKAVVSGGLLMVLLSWFDLHLLLDLFTHIALPWLVLGMVLHQTQYLLSAKKWQVILRADGHDVPLTTLWKVYLISGFFGLFLPSGIGGDVHRVWALRRHGIMTSKSAASVLFDRVTGLFMLLSIGVIGAALTVGRELLPYIFAGYGLVVALGLVLSSNRVAGRLPEARGRYTGFVIRVLQSFNCYRNCRLTLWVVAGISLLFQFNIVLIVWCYTRALHIVPGEVSFSELLAIVPTVFLTDVLPISINGVGVREGAFSYFFGLAGSTGAKGLALSLLLTADRYFVALPGGLMQMMQSAKGGVEAAEPV